MKNKFKSDLWIWFAVTAGYWFMSAAMLIFAQDEKWFSRAMASLFCQAIAAILYKMEKR